VVDHAIGSKLDLNTGVSLQVAIGVIDMCPQWCGVYGDGTCHSPAPYIDRVQVLRVDVVGPQWDVRDVDLFQDTFATNGTISGTARADAALDVKRVESPSFTPGDSAVVFYLLDPKYVVGTGTNANGLLADPVVSTYNGRHKTKKQVYMYASVWPQGQAAKTGAALSEGPGGQANRYPFMGTIVVNGVTWTKIRMDYTYGSCPFMCDPEFFIEPFVPNRFNVDLNDNLFTPGDTVCYFFRATSADGTNYYSENLGVTSSMAEAAANPMEFTILRRAASTAAATFSTWTARMVLATMSISTARSWALGLADKIDRYDVRGPSSGVSNRLAGRVKSVANQLNACYRTILWDCGPLSVTLGDGTGDPEKTDDYALVNSFLAGLTQRGGVYLCGDDVASVLSGQAGASAVAFQNLYMPFTLINGNHRLAPTSFPISPTIKYWPGRAFSDNFFIFGGCPDINDFDVLGAIATSQVQMSYNTASNTNGAVVSNVSGNAVIMLSGFSFASIRDDELDGILDRAKHIRDILFFLGNTLPSSGVLPSSGDHLAQNYPNPFNPQTTIAYSIKARGYVRLSVYDVGGRLVRMLANEVRPAGAQQVTWDGKDANGTAVASGVYFYRLVAGDFTQTKKMVLLK